MKFFFSIAFALSIAWSGLAPRCEAWSGPPPPGERTLPVTSSGGQTKSDAGAHQQPAPTAPVPLPKGKKLVLLDGTFQIVREYSVQADRVRYWSLERSDWEEIPANLVDWNATHKAEADLAQHDDELKARIHASDVAERTKDIDVDRSLEIKPNIFLPDGKGFYGLDGKAIVELKQSLAASKKSTAREMERIMSGISIIPSKQTLEIAGEHAAKRINSAEPEFFMRPADGREPQVRLLRAQIKAGHRLLDSASLIVTGEQVHHAQDVDFQTWTPASGVFRYTVSEHLPPGEYAFVEMVNGEINSYVWDFGIEAAGSKPGK